MRTIMFCLAILLAQATSAAVLYNVVDLGPGIACGISDNGYIMGGDASGQLWRMKDTVKQSFSVPVFSGRINSSGQMVGGSLDGSYFYCDGVTLTSWVSSRRWPNYPDFFNINSHGVAVGQGANPAQCYTIVNGVRTALPSDYLGACAINDSGAIAGDSLSGHALFVQAADGSVTSHLYPFANCGYVMDMANNGHITGFNDDAQWYIYDGQQFTFLPGNNYGVPQAINESDVVVGGYWSYFGFVYRDGTMFNLDSLIAPSSGWHITEAFDVNNNGQIVGAAMINGQQHAVLLNPIPEPTTMAILGLSAFAILRKRRSL